MTKKPTLTQKELLGSDKMFNCKGSEAGGINPGFEHCTSDGNKLRRATFLNGTLAPSTW